tara:strand:- start:50780 stop:51199 length:420 start_codon:yes stop_codon:yes gene_type:complete
MTDYCTQADLEARFGAQEILELTDRNADNVADAGVLENAIADAGAVIDTFVAKRYDLPLAEVPPALVKTACDIARYNLHGDLPTTTVAENFKYAMTFLRDIAAGKAVLDIAGTEPAGAENEILIGGPDRMFTSDSLKDY